MVSKWKDVNSRKPDWFNWRNVLTVIFVSGTVGIALKWVALFDKWVYFPFFPDILDATFLVISVLFLALKGSLKQDAV